MPKKLDLDSEEFDEPKGMGLYRKIKEGETETFRILEAPVLYEEGERDFFGSVQNFDGIKMKAEIDGEVKALNVQKTLGRSLKRLLEKRELTFGDEETKKLIITAKRFGMYDWKCVVEEKLDEVPPDPSLESDEDTEDETSIETEVEKDAGDSHVADKILDKLNSEGGSFEKTKLKTGIFLYDSDISDSDTVENKIDEMVDEGVLREETVEGDGREFQKISLNV